MRGAWFAVWLALGCGVSHPVDPSPSPRVAAGRLATVLAQAVDEDGRLRWEAVQASADDLEQYASWLARRRRPSLTRAIGRRAFYLNALDGLTLWVAVRRWPSGPLPDEPWEAMKRDTVWLDGYPIRLVDLDQHLIRTRLQDYRLEVGVHRLSASDPPWPASPWREKGLIAALETAWTGWLADPSRGLRVTDAGLEVPEPLADRALDLQIQTGGEGMCEVLAAHTRGTLRLAVEAERGRGCRWAVRKRTEGAPAP